jgi:hypothetical protein
VTSEDELRGRVDENSVTSRSSEEGLVMDFLNDVHEVTGAGAVAACGTSFHNHFGSFFRQDGDE